MRPPTRHRTAADLICATAPTLTPQTPAPSLGAMSTAPATDARDDAIALPFCADRVDETGPMHLRPVVPSDLDALFAHQADPEAAALIPRQPRGRQAFFDKWGEVLADPAYCARAVVWQGEVAGHVICFERDGRREIGWHLDRAHWGKGRATRAVAMFLASIDERPLWARVWCGNQASRALALRLGFVSVERRRVVDDDGQEREDELLRLS